MENKVIIGALCYRNNDKEIEMHMEKLKRWQLILLRVENSYGIALRSVPEGADVINEIKAILNATSAYLDRIGDLDKKIEVLLSSIQDSKIRTVMYHYYVLGETWDDIAAILNISKRTVLRLHGYGLEIIKHMQEEDTVIA